MSVVCPKCGGPMWDNREKKTNPKAPDFKCKDKENCDGVIWPPRQFGSKAPAKSVRELDAEEPSLPIQANATTVLRPVKEPTSVTADVLDYFNILISVVDKFQVLMKDVDKDLAGTATFADVKEITTTIYIQRSKRG